MANEQNLVPFTSEQSREDAARNGRKGGIASGVAKRARKSFAEDIKKALAATIQPSHPKYAEIKRMLRSSGLLADGDPTNQIMIIAGMLQRAQKDPAAAAFLRDTVGERPKDEVAMEVNAPPVVIGIHDSAYIDEERKRQDRMLEDMRAVDAETRPLAAEKPPTGAPTKNAGNASPEEPEADAARPDAPTADPPQPVAKTDPPERKKMTRAEAIAEMERKRKANGGAANAESRPAVKPVFLPSGFGRRK